MIKKFKTVLFIIILFLIVVNNFVYARNYNRHESIEIKLKNYKDTPIVIKDKDGNEMKSDENFVQIVNNKIIIENEFMETELISLENITIEITNNLGVKDTLNFDFKNPTTYDEKNYLYHYNCDNGKIHDFSIFKECKMLITKNKLVFILASIILLISCIFIYKIIFIIFGIIKKFLHYVLYIKRK